MWALKRNGNGKEQTDDPLPEDSLRHIRASRLGNGWMKCYEADQVW